MSIKAAFPTNEHNSIKLEYLLKSLTHFNIPYDIINLDKNFSYINKIFSFYEYLKKQNDNDIIIFSDAYDVFYVNSLQTIKKRFEMHNVGILWSCEKGYYHGLEKQKKIYDMLGENYHYKYLNSGTFMGYVYALRKYIGEIILEIKNKNSKLNIDLKNNGCKCTPLTYLSGVYGEHFCDQQIYGYWYAENYDKYSVRLDYNCSVFYLPVNDWDDIHNFIDFDKQKLYVRQTKTKPCIVHCPWLSKYRNVYDYIYSSVFIPVFNKKYVWQHDCDYVNGYILFNLNNLETTWGNGTYNQISDRIYILIWQDTKHILTFNEDFTKFKSVRQNDLHVSSGELLPKGFDIY